MVAVVDVVLVPGFTQTAASWDAVAPLVPDARAVDIPLRATFAETAAALGAMAGAGIYVGYSMGGRLSLRLALDRPDLVHGLVLVSASPGITDAGERAARARSDEALAQSIERDGVAVFLDRWLAQPMFATVPSDAPGLAERSTLDAPYVAGCLRVLGAGRMHPMWDELGSLTMPVALVTGTLDEKYDAIATAMCTRLRAPVVHVRLEGGHALPLEQPVALAAVIAEFAAEHG